MHNTWARAMPSSIVEARVEARFRCHNPILLCPTRKPRCRTIVAPSVHRQRFNSTQSTQAAEALPILSRHNLQLKAPRTYTAGCSHLPRNRVRCLMTTARGFNMSLSTSNSRCSIRLRRTLTNLAMPHPAHTRNCRPLHHPPSHSIHLRRGRTRSRTLRNLHTSNKQVHPNPTRNNGNM